MTDQELIFELRNSETRQRAFRTLISTYQERVYWIARKMVLNHDDADDITQEVFISIWKNLDAFRQDAKLFTWIYRITTNACLNFLKKRKLDVVNFEDAEHELASRSQHHDLHDSDEIERKLKKALLTLPAKQRMVFNLRYYDELKYEDIAEITNTSVGALKANYHHAVKKIENILNND